MRFVAEIALPSVAASCLTVTRVVARPAAARPLPHYVFHGQVTFLVANKGCEERRTAPKEPLVRHARIMVRWEISELTWELRYPDARRFSSNGVSETVLNLISPN
jgi:hypothetical protein